MLANIWELSNKAGFSSSQQRFHYNPVSNRLFWSNTTICDGKRLPWMRLIAIGVCTESYDFSLLGSSWSKSWYDIALARVSSHLCKTRCDCRLCKVKSSSHFHTFKAIILFPFKLATSVLINTVLMYLMMLIHTLKGESAITTGKITSNRYFFPTFQGHFPCKEWFLLMYCTY